MIKNTKPMPPQPDQMHVRGYDITGAIISMVQDVNTAYSVIQPKKKKKNAPVALVFIANP